MSDEPLVFHYDPDHNPYALLGDEPGATPAYLYVWSGAPGPAKVVRVIALTGDDGEVVIEPVGELEDCQVIDVDGDTE